MNGDFKGKVAVVTGASSGIGRACAVLYAAQGAKVVVSDVNVPSGEQTVASIKSSGGDATFVHCDVSNSASVAKLLDQTVATYGRLDIAVNNAGIEGKMALTADCPEEIWNNVIAVNLSGVWYCMRHEIPEMLKSGGGSIINISSILGVVGFANAAAYTAAKHGVIGLTKAAAIEYASQGIRINAVCPAFIYTPMLERSGITPGTDFYNGIAAMHPIKRLGTAEEVADAVLWLSSPGASFMAGHSLMVDGGYVAQ